MTTKASPLSALKQQADKIAAMIKAAERGEKIDVLFASRIAAARAGPSFKVGIVMDDKVITVELPWETISQTGEVGLSEFILKHMREIRDN